MSYFGLITAPGPLTVLAYIGTFGPLALAAWLLVPDAVEQLRVWWTDSRHRPATAHVAHHRVEGAADAKQ
jgi:hypothetical protein